MKIAYCDCFSGIAGDMFLAAAVDAGMPIDYLNEQIQSINFGQEVKLNILETRKGAVRAAQLDIQLGKMTGHNHEHHHDDEHHHHHHRHLNDILQIIEQSGLTKDAKLSASEIFTKLAEAEARVHGESIENVHFHEVGAVDSIIDICGAAIALDYFKIERLFSSPLPFSTGTVKTDHGLLPVPAPATLELLKTAGAPMRSTKMEGEVITPTGAAILASNATFERPDFLLESVGIGAGTKDFPWANIFRLMIGRSVEREQSSVVLMETNIDDMNPEVYSYLFEKLFENGALDVFTTPIHMKKNRPATKLSIIAKKADESNLAELIIRESTTFGIRVQPVFRYESERRTETVETSFGKVQIKIKCHNDKNLQAVPEYEDCAALARENNVPFGRVYTEALIEGMKFIES